MIILEAEEKYFDEEIVGVEVEEVEDGEGDLPRI